RVGRERARGRRAAGRASRRRGRADRLRARAPRGLQGAALGVVRRRAAEDRVREDPEALAARALLARSHDESELMTRGELKRQVWRAIDQRADAVIGIGETIRRQPE